jgi:hypothetical protein
MADRTDLERTRRRHLVDASPRSHHQLDFPGGLSTIVVTSWAAKLSLKT